MVRAPWHSKTERHHGSRVQSMHLEVSLQGPISGSTIHYLTLGLFSLGLSFLIRFLRELNEGKLW